MAAESRAGAARRPAKNPRKIFPTCGEKIASPEKHDLFYRYKIGKVVLA
jgi:hypothetical protein